jgi:hypothetical protein
MKAISNVREAITIALAADAKHAQVVAYFGEPGCFDAEPNEAAKKLKAEANEELYQQLSKQRGGIAAKAAKLTKDAWQELSGKDRKEYQAERNYVKVLVDNRWARMKLAWKQAGEEKAAAEAAESGEPQVAKVKKSVMDRWAAFEVESTKAVKKTGELDAQLFAEWTALCRAGLQKMLDDRKL